MPNNSKSQDSKTTLRPAQRQRRQPGIETQMRPRPDALPPDPRAPRLQGRRALITGGDSGIGRAVALAFAREGADVAIVYLNEHRDAEDTARMVMALGRRCAVIPGDLGKPAFCRQAVARAVRALDGLDILVNNAAEQHRVEDPGDMDLRDVEKTFRTNILSMFALTKHALPHLLESAKWGQRQAKAEARRDDDRDRARSADERLGFRAACVINTTSVTAYRGSPGLIDYSATKGAIVAFTRSLSGALAEKNIRVNAVAPGPVWTPLIPATFKPKDVATFGSDVPLKRAADPAEIAPAYVYLASDDASFVTGQVIHVNGGEIVNG